jgi:hypothetical protein
VEVVVAVEAITLVVRVGAVGHIPTIALVPGHIASPAFARAAVATAHTIDTGEARFTFGGELTRITGLAVGDTDPCARTVSAWVAIEVVGTARVAERCLVGGLGLVGRARHGQEGTAVVGGQSEAPRVIFDEGSLLALEDRIASRISTLALACCGVQADARLAIVSGRAVCADGAAIANGAAEAVLTVAGDAVRRLVTGFAVGEIGYAEVEIAVSVVIALGVGRTRRGAEGLRLVHDARAIPTRVGTAVIG